MDDEEGLSQKKLARYCYVHLREFRNLNLTLPLLLWFCPVHDRRDMEFMGGRKIGGYLKGRLNVPVQTPTVVAACSTKFAGWV